MLLDELAKHDKKWRGMALTICKDSMLADDLTQEMYLKLHTRKKQFNEINDFYIFLTIKTLFVDHLRKAKKEIPFSRLNDVTKSFFKIDDTDAVERLKKREMLNDALSELKMFHREILLHTSERSLRKNVEYFKEGDLQPMTVRSLHYNKHIALDKLKETKTIKKYKNGRI